MDSTPSNDSSSIGGGMFPLANINFGNLKFADILGSDDISYIVPTQPANDSRLIEVNEAAKSEDGAKNAS
jgi:hypothetical protein